MRDRTTARRPEKRHHPDRPPGGARLGLGDGRTDAAAVGGGSDRRLRCGLAVVAHCAARDDEKDLREIQVIFKFPPNFRSIFASMR